MWFVTFSKITICHSIKSFSKIKINLNTKNYRNGNSILNTPRNIPRNRKVSTHKKERILPDIPDCKTARQIPELLLPHTNKNLKTRMPINASNYVTYYSKRVVPPGSLAHGTWHSPRSEFYDLFCTVEH